VAHALSASALRSNRLSPPALALAVLLHAAVALALWWLSLNRPQLPPTEEAIDITFEQPKPEEPPPPPPERKPEPQPPAPPVDLGLRPPAPLTSDKPTQVPPAAAEPSKETPTPPPPPQQEALAPPQLEPPQPTPAPTPKPSELTAPAGRVPPEQALAAPPPTPPKPTPRAPRPELRPSPLSTAPQRRPPAAAPAVEQPSPHRFVNPADAYNRARIADNYLWQVARKLEGYRYQANVSARQGITVVRIVIARNGRLLDVAVARSSGVPEFDQGVIAGVRAGSPYTPLPPDIPGESATFNLPLVSVNRQ
jgi:TonB family protein